MRLLLVYCFARGAIRALLYPEQTDRLRRYEEERRWIRENYAPFIKAWGDDSLGYVISLAMAIQLTKERFRL